MARCPKLQALLPTVQKISNCNFLDAAELNKDSEAFKEWVNMPNAALKIFSFFANCRNPKWLKTATR